MRSHDRFVEHMTWDEVPIGILAEPAATQPTRSALP